MKFVEVTSIISEQNEDKLTQNDAAGFQIFFNDIQVTVPSNFNQDSFAGLMKVLQQL